MGAVELLALLFLLMRGDKPLFGSAASPATPPGTTPPPTPSTPQLGPVPAKPPAAPAATAPPPGVPATQQQARAQTAAAQARRPFPQAVPAGLPPFPGPGWKPFVPTPSAVVTRAGQLLPTLWAQGAGARKIEQTAGQWASYVAVPGPNGRKDVNVWKLANPEAAAQANA